MVKSDGLESKSTLYMAANGTDYTNILSKKTSFKLNLDMLVLFKLRINSHNKFPLK